MKSSAATIQSRPASHRRPNRGIGRIIVANAAVVSVSTTPESPESRAKRTQRAFADESQRSHTT